MCQSVLRPDMCFPMYVTRHSKYLCDFERPQFAQFGQILHRKVIIIQSAPRYQVHHICTSATQLHYPCVHEFCQIYCPVNSPLLWWSCACHMCSKYCYSIFTETSQTPDSTAGFASTVSCFTAHFCGPTTVVLKEHCCTYVSILSKVARLFLSGARAKHGSVSVPFWWRLLLLCIPRKSMAIR